MSLCLTFISSCHHLATNVVIRLNRYYSLLIMNTKMFTFRSRLLDPYVNISEMWMES